MQGSTRGLCWHVVPKLCMVPAGAVLGARGGCNGLCSGPVVGCLFVPLVKLSLNLLGGRSMLHEWLLIFAKLLQRTALNILIYSQHLS